MSEFSAYSLLIHQRKSDRAKIICVAHVHQQIRLFKDFIMLQDNSFKPAFRRYLGFNRLTIFAVATLGFMLAVIYPLLSEAAPKGRKAENNLSSPEITLPFSSLALTSNVGATGVLEICKVASGAGLADRIFRFQIGANIYSVPVGGCSAPITLPAGTVTVTELIDGPLTTTGTFSGRFRLLDVSSNVSGAITNLNLPTRTVTVNVREGNTANLTRLTFTNTFAISAVVEICKFSSGANVTGSFNFTIDALPNTVITVAVGTCSPPIQVNVPTVPGPVVQPSQIKVTELGRAGFPLSSVSTFPSNRFNSLTLGLGIDNTKPNCIKTIDPVAEGCTFVNPGGGYVDIDILEGGTHSGTTVNFFNRSGSLRAATAFDFDGDGKADISVFRPSEGNWYLLNSSSGFAGINFGLGTDKIVPADYDGDGKTDIAVFRDGNWYLLRSQLGFTGISFGLAGDIPLPADYDGDGKTDLAVLRPSTGALYILRSSLGFTGIQFGLNGDKPVIADYDGDGKADLAVFRNGSWYLLRSQQGFVGVSFGIATDIPVPADYDGDGKADLAVFRPDTGVWHILRSRDGFLGFAFGLGTDKPVPADYDGDGKTDIAVFREGVWYIQRTTAGFLGIQFGTATDKPIPNAYIP